MDCRCNLMCPVASLALRMSIALWLHDAPEEHCSRSSIASLPASADA